MSRPDSPPERYRLEITEMPGFDRPNRNDAARSAGNLWMLEAVESNTACRYRVIWPSMRMD